MMKNKHARLKTMLLELKRLKKEQSDVRALIKMNANKKNKKSPSIGNLRKVVNAGS